MKFIITLVVLSVCAVALARPDGEKYTTKYDNFDVDSVINNRRLLENYVNCILDKGKCTKEGAELKKHVGDALASECNKCSEVQQRNAKKVLKHLYEKERPFFDALEAKYDPEQKYRVKYEAEIKKEGINV